MRIALILILLTGILLPTATDAYTGCCQVVCVPQAGTGQQDIRCFDLTAASASCDASSLLANCSSGYTVAAYNRVDNQTCAQQAACSGAGAGATTGETRGSVVGFGNPLCPNPAQPCDPPAVIGRIIKTVLGIVGSIALLMFIYGGFIWMLGGQRGSEKKVRYAKEILVWTTLGMLVIFGAYIFVEFIIERFRPQ